MSNFNKDIASVSIDEEGQMSIFLPEVKKLMYVEGTATFNCSGRAAIPTVTITMPVNIVYNEEEARRKYKDSGNIISNDRKYDDLPPHISRSMVDPDHPDYINGSDLVEAIKRAKQRDIL